jgi:hypothetical protein
MTEANRLPSLPGWVAGFTTRGTTRDSLRRDAWFDMIGAGMLCGLGALAAYFWGFTWTVALIPAAWMAAGLWKLAAASWLDRNRAWERVAVLPLRPGMPRVAGAVLLLVGLLLLALSGWRFWACFLGPDDALWGSLTLPSAQESLQLVQEHAAKVKAIRARGAAAQEREDELRRFNAAHDELRRRQAEELRAAAPRWRWFEFGAASILLLMGLFFCWHAYQGFSPAKRDRAPETSAASDRDRQAGL